MINLQLEPLNEYKDSISDLFQRFQRQVVSQKKGVANLLEEILGADWLPLHIKLDPCNLGIVVGRQTFMNLVFCSIEPVSAYFISLIDYHDLILLPFFWLKQYICKRKKIHQSYVIYGKYLEINN